MIKVGFVINYIVKNGPSSVLLNIINNLDQNEFEPSLITLFEGNDLEVVKNLREKGIKVYECKTLSRVKCILGFAKDFQKLIKNQGFNVLHTHGLIPDIVVSRLNGNIRKISTIHNNMFEDYLETYGKLKSEIFIRMHLAALKKLDENVCCAKSVYDVLKKQLNNITYICNGIEDSNAEGSISRKIFGISEDSKIFMYAGALSKGKNIVWLIENFIKSHEKNEYLLVLGTGDEEKKCKEIADESVKMLGFKKNPMDYMKISDVYVSASKSEGFSISVLEALSNGLGLLLSDIPSHREIVTMSESVYLGELFQKDSFENALKELRNHELNKELIKNFQKTFLSASEMTKQYASRYKN